MLWQAPICALNLEALLLTEVNYFGSEISQLEFCRIASV
jgi:hypothetical protein